MTTVMGSYRSLYWHDQINTAVGKEAMLLRQPYRAVRAGSKVQRCASGLDAALYLRKIAAPKTAASKAKEVYVLVPLVKTNQPTSKLHTHVEELF